jgi:UDP-N-acetylglucosamine 2-epimerase (non-hydrolysing)
MPFPEEMNRVVTGRYASLHFAPTQTNATALILEGVRPAEIWVTGNTVIDALFYILRAPRPALPTRGKPFVLVTAHRRENHGAPMMEICAAIKALAHEQPALDFVVPVHPNPLVKNMVEAELSGCANVLLLGPQPYDVFCWLMKECQLILSDSGGVQEEAPALGKPVLVLRDETERPEARELGATKLVGPHAEAIVREARVLLEMGAAYTRMATAGSPYGDGTASVKIARVIADALRLGA